MSVNFQTKESYGMEDLLAIMRLLRGEGGCPWDREQTHQSIRKNFIEETYEVCEAIDLEDQELLREELGDVLLQVVFHSQMEQEAGHFGFAEVCDGICKKLIQRHPHVFGQVQVEGSGQVLENWEAIKQQSKGQTTQTEAVRSVPKTLPALMRAQKVQKRASKSGFCYPDVYWAMDDLESELDELQEAMDQQDKAACQEELGDVLFAAANVARFLGVDAEESLTGSTEKFIARFARVEEMARQRGIDMAQAEISVLEDLWEEAKAWDGAREK